MMKWNRLLALIVVLSTALAAQAGTELEAEFQRLIQEAKLRNTAYGLCVVDVSAGQTLVAMGASEPLIPASNMKLVTTAAALGNLGPNFAFRTELRLLELDAAGKATLLVRGDGDPALGDPKMFAAHNLDMEKAAAVWAGAVKKAGVKTIGKLYVDDRVFDRQLVHPTWPENQLDTWYCAPVAGVNINDNCLEVYPAPTTPGRAAAVRIEPEAPFVTVLNRAVTGERDNFIITRRSGSGEYVCTGTVRTRAVEPIEITLADPAVFFAQYFAYQMGKAGIGVEALSLAGADERFPEGKPLPDLQRTELSAVLQRCNKDSQNLFAECLLKRMGRQMTGTPGSWENGAAAVRNFLTHKLGAGAGSVAIADGSGMSRENRISAQAMVDLLAAMARDAKLWPLYRASLSVDTSDGSMRKRYRRLPENLRERLLPKTGYINNVVTLSGYLLIPAKGTQAEKVLAFSFLFNGEGGGMSPAVVQDLQDKFLLALDASM